jgi:hypothetical protein
MKKQSKKQQSFKDATYTLVRDIRRAAGLSDLTSKEFKAAFLGRV